MPRFIIASRFKNVADRMPGLERAIWRSEAGLLDLLWGSARRLSPDRASDLGCRVGRLFGVRSRKNRHVLANLATAFPDWPKARVEQVARSSWGEVGRTVAEFPHLAAIAGEPERAQIVDLGGIEAVKASGRPAIFVAPHLANWNLLPIAAVRSGVPLSALYSPQSNPFIDERIKESQRALRCRLIAVEDGRGMLKDLKEGRSIGLLMDQRFDAGEMIPFFGHPAATPVAPARLAVKLGIPFVPCRVERLEGAHFRVSIHPPVQPDSSLEPRMAARSMVEQVNHLFEAWIRAAPEQWLCAKRRWPKASPVGGETA
ncbi:lysophospholipid acyltransferase family protein [Marinimicrococcus flavescens]|uniref:Lysophospholipid acyltransferase family protein n=1 Tax=Marinimicrococcus flavescens TaxID=3031815 RepID=A0AAP4D6G6_9PROT|nr:lysophospholipid acyltransferase family protein [Marinimicrococcus flavescens]